MSKSDFKTTLNCYGGDMDSSFKNLAHFNASSPSSVAFGVKNVDFY